LENATWQTKPVCSVGTGKIIEKMRGVFKSHGPNCAPNHEKDGIKG